MSERKEKIPLWKKTKTGDLIEVAEKNNSPECPFCNKKMTKKIGLDENISWICDCKGGKNMSKLFE